MFISFEGIDKSGKTTQIKLLASFLLSKNCSLVMTQEPGGTTSGERIKKIILGDSEVDSLTELFLYLADRAQHVKEVIKPSLEKKKIVISDRYTDASLAYQGYGRGLGFDFVNQLNLKVTRGIKPDLTFLLDLEPEKAIHRGKRADRIEKEKLFFHKKVREGYLEIAKSNPNRVKLIKADASFEKIHKMIKDVICQELSL